MWLVKSPHFSDGSPAPTQYVAGDKIAGQFFQIHRSDSTRWPDLSHFHVGQTIAFRGLSSCP